LKYILLLVRTIPRNIYFYWYVLSQEIYTSTGTYYPKKYILLLVRTIPRNIYLYWYVLSQEIYTSTGTYYPKKYILLLVRTIPRNHITSIFQEPLLVLGVYIEKSIFSTDFVVSNSACPFTLCRGFFYPQYRPCTPKIVGTFYMQVEMQQISNHSLLFDPTRPGIELTIYHNWGKKGKYSCFMNKFRYFYTYRSGFWVLKLGVQLLFFP
jgi:hypothetical protein